MPLHHDLQSESEEDTQAALLAAIGNPAELAARLNQFCETAQVLSSSQHEMTEKYAKQWVALYQGKVVTFGDDVTSILRDLDQQCVPHTDAIIRFIDPEPQTLILSMA